MTAEALPIYRDQDFYVPTFEVRIGEKPVKPEVVNDIIQSSYKDGIDEVDSFEITLNNWDANKRDFKYSDTKLFDPGKRVELWMGYHGQGQLRLMLKGEITSLRPSFPAGGQPTLSVSGLNLIHRLRTEQVSRSYIKKTDNQIAREIGARLGVKIEPKEPATGTQEPYEYLFQNNQYDILFLMERARRIGYDLFVVEPKEGGKRRPSVLEFGPSEKVQRATYELTYGKSLIDFQPNLTTANQVGSVTVRGWDAVRKKAIEVTATRKDLTTKGVGDRADQQVIEQSFNQRKEIITDKPVQSEQEARNLAKQTLERIAKDMITASGSVVGLPDLRTGSVLTINGVGKRFSGRYFVTSTTHTIGGGGYTTKFDCRREELKDKEKKRGGHR